MSKKERCKGSWRKQPPLGFLVANCRRWETRCQAPEAHAAALEKQEAEAPFWRWEHPQSGSSFLHSIQASPAASSQPFAKAEVGKSTSIRSLAGQHKPAEGTWPLQSCPTGGSRKDVGAADNTDGKVTQLQPRGGLFAFRDDQPVFILSVRTSRKIPLADVVPLKQATFQGRTVLKAKYTETRTCRWSELKDVGLHFQIANCANDRRGASGLASMIFCNMLPSFKERPATDCFYVALHAYQKQPGETQGDQGRALRENAALAARWQAGNAELGLATSCTVDHSVRSVVPVRLRAHLAERAASGITHHAAPRADESRSFWIPRLN